MNGNKVGDSYKFDTTEDGQWDCVTPRGHEQASGQMFVRAINGDHAIVHVRIETWDDRNPKGTSNIVDRDFEWPLIGIEFVGGYQWQKQ